MKTRFIGGLLGLLCAAHCLLVPMLFALVPGLQLALHQFGSTQHQLAQVLLWSLALEPWLVGLALLSTGVSLLSEGGYASWWAWSIAVCLMLVALFSRASLPIHGLLLLCGSLLLWTAPMLRRRAKSQAS